MNDKRSNEVTLEITKNSDESAIFSEHFAWVTAGIPDHIDEIIYIGFTEMVNNAIDHSEGTEINIIMERSQDNIDISISDNGEGIFTRIKRIFSLYDERQAILELSKGKLTTDPENHSGQGIFFTSRMFDNYLIYSNNLTYYHDEESSFDLLNGAEIESDHQGTGILMGISLKATTTAKEIYDLYTGSEEENYSFNKTIVPVRLSKIGQEKLISRSQAKRLLARIENFKTVILDFQGVDKIGQAFADEIFRVYIKKNPEIQLYSKNENNEVSKMIKQAKHLQLGNCNPLAIPFNASIGSELP